MYDFFFFFFSSRRRHTRFDCDWSSDVCSSDLDWRAPVTEHEGVSNGPAAQLQHWRDQLQSQSRGYVVLYGNTARQWQQLAESLRLKAPQMDWSWLPASPVQRSARLRPYGCEQCSDQIGRASC